MGKYKFEYTVYKDCDEVLTAAAEVSFTKKDLKAIEKELREWNGTAQFADIPEELYEKCEQAAFDAAWEAVPDMANSDYTEYEVLPEWDMPDSIVAAMPEDLQEMIK